MSEYRTNTTIEALAQRILASKRILLTTHQKPDGDAMGSALALHRALKAKGKQPTIYLMGPIEPGLIVIAGRTPFTLVEREMPDDSFDLAIVTDTGAWSQLEPLAGWLKRHHEQVIGIDHHTRGDSDVAAVRLVDATAVSSTAVLVPVLDAMKCELTGGVEGVAEALFAGLATDSGWFRYESARADAFRLAGRLLECGVDKSRLYQILEETFRPQRLALEARALASLRYEREGSVAIQLLHPVDFQATGGAIEDLTGMVNTPMSVGAVRVSILLAQSAANLTKISFRSKPTPAGQSAHELMDVNQLAQRFGGGGHVHAAGARIAKPMDEALQDVLAAIRAPKSPEAPAARQRVRS